MGLTVATQTVFGGIDSRSNPLNFPRKRSLRCLNWVPKEAGFLELRYGYAVTNQQAASGTRIVNFASYKKLDGTKLLVFFDGTTPKVMNLATGAVTVPTVRGTAFASAAKGSFVFVNNRLYFYNGTDKKWFDGTTWRDVGIRAPSAAEGAAVNVAIGAGDASGVAASTVGGANPGYQLYMAYYNPTTGHVSNRILIGARVVPTVASDLSITGLPDLSGLDTELVKVIGRTGDGAATPYAAADTAGNWFTVANAATTATLNVSSIDGNAELPTRNTQPPAFDKIVIAGDYLYGNQPGSATIYRSGSYLLKRQGTFVGNPEECWAANDIETFPTNQAVSCLGEYASDLWAFSLTDMDILGSDTTGIMGWQGTKNIGCCGQRAFFKSPYGPFWVSGEKELGTMTASGPVSSSEEYEQALLAQIGDANLGATEVRYFRDKTKGIDQILINCLDTNGAPFKIHHDFKLREGGGSEFGQAYTSAYQSVLSTAHSIEVVRDANDRMRVWAGASDGKLYELFNGANDNGIEYAADFITILNAGPNRPSVPFIQWYGDSTVVVSIGRTLSTSLANGAQFQFENLTSQPVPGSENDFFYKADQTRPEMKNPIVRFQLNSHSADGTLALNNPPHVPLENYGRIYAVMPEIGQSRGAA